MARMNSKLIVCMHHNDAIFEHRGVAAQFKTIA